MDGEAFAAKLEVEYALAQQAPPIPFERLEQSGAILAADVKSLAAQEVKSNPGTILQLLEELQIVAERRGESFSPGGVVAPLLGVIADVAEEAGYPKIQELRGLVADCERNPHSRFVATHTTSELRELVRWARQEGKSLPAQRTKSNPATILSLIASIPANSLDNPEGVYEVLCDAAEEAGYPDLTKLRAAVEDFTKLAKRPNPRLSLVKYDDMWEAIAQLREWARQNKKDLSAYNANAGGALVPPPAFPGKKGEKSNPTTIVQLMEANAPPEIIADAAEEAGFGPASILTRIRKKPQDWGHPPDDDWNSLYFWAHRGGKSLPAQHGKSMDPQSLLRNIENLAVDWKIARQDYSDEIGVYADALEEMGYPEIARLRRAIQWYGGSIDIAISYYENTPSVYTDSVRTAYRDIENLRGQLSRAFEWLHWHVREGKSFPTNVMQTLRKHWRAKRLGKVVHLKALPNARTKSSREEVHRLIYSGQTPIEVILDAAEEAGYDEREIRAMRSVVETLHREKEQGLPFDHARMLQRIGWAHIFRMIRWAEGKSLQTHRKSFDDILNLIQAGNVPPGVIADAAEEMGYPNLRRLRAAANPALAPGTHIVKIPIKYRLMGDRYDTERGTIYPTEVRIGDGYGIGSIMFPQIADISRHIGQEVGSISLPDWQDVGDYLGVQSWSLELSELMRWAVNQRYGRKSYGKSMDPDQLSRWVDKFYYQTQAPAPGASFNFDELGVVADALEEAGWPRAGDLRKLIPDITSGDQRAWHALKHYLIDAMRYLGGLHSKSLKGQSMIPRVKASPFAQTKVIQKQGSGYVLRARHGNHRVLGHHATRAGAMRQEAAIHAQQGKALDFDVAWAMVQDQAWDPLFDYIYENAVEAADRFGDDTTGNPPWYDAFETNVIRGSIGRIQRAIQRGNADGARGELRSILYTYRKSLPRQGTKAFKRGKDKLGREYCTNDGVRVACSNKPQGGEPRSPRQNAPSTAPGPRKPLLQRAKEGAQSAINKIEPKTAIKVAVAVGVTVQVAAMTTAAVLAYKYLPAETKKKMFADIMNGLRTKWKDALADPFGTINAVVKQGEELSKTAAAVGGSVAAASAAINQLKTTDIAAAGSGQGDLIDRVGRRLLESAGVTHSDKWKEAAADPTNPENARWLNQKRQEIRRQVLNGEIPREQLAKALQSVDATMDYGDFEAIIKGKAQQPTEEAEPQLQPVEGRQEAKPKTAGERNYGAYYLSAKDEDYLTDIHKLSPTERQAAIQRVEQMSGRKYPSIVLNRIMDNPRFNFAGRARYREAMTNLSHALQEAREKPHHAYGAKINEWRVEVDTIRAAVMQQIKRGEVDARFISDALVDAREETGVAMKYDEFIERAMRTNSHIVNEAQW